MTEVKEEEQEIVCDEEIVSTKEQEVRKKIEQGRLVIDADRIADRIIEQGHLVPGSDLK